MSDKDRIPAEVFILFKLEGLKTALSDSPFMCQLYFRFSAQPASHICAWMSSLGYFTIVARNAFPLFR